MTGDAVAADWPPPIPNGNPSPPVPSNGTGSLGGLVGVRCPRCHLGGDIPESIERTICPRCDTVFTVATARVDPPKKPSAPQPPKQPATSVPPAASAPSSTHVPPAATGPTTAASTPTATSVPSKPRTPPSPRPGEIPLTLPPLSDPPLWPKLLIGGIAIFLAGVVVGWALTRGSEEGAQPATARPTTTTRPTPAAARTDTTPTASPTATTATDNGQEPAATDAVAPDEPAPLEPAPEETANPPEVSTDDPAAVIAPPPALLSAPAARRPGGPTTVVPVPKGPQGSSLPIATTTSVVACEGLDCRMTSTSSIHAIPIPDDAIALDTTGDISGWSTKVATVEALTEWYRSHLTQLGWRLAREYSVLDPELGEQRGIGHTTSAIYCGTDDTIAVNIGWPLSDHSGTTVIIAIATAPQPLDCA